LDARLVVCASFPASALGVDGGAVEALDADQCDAPVATVAGPPRRPSEPFPHVILAGDRIVAGKTVHDEAAVAVD